MSASIPKMYRLIPEFIDRSARRAVIMEWLAAYDPYKEFLDVLQGKLIKGVEMPKDIDQALREICKSKVLLL